MRGLNERPKEDFGVMLARCENAPPLDIAHVTEVLRLQGRHVMADCVEALSDYATELKIKLEKAVKNRPPRYKKRSK